MTSATAGLASKEDRIDLVVWCGEVLASGEDWAGEDDGGGNREAILELSFRWVI